MKRILLPIAISVGSSLISIAPAAAQDVAFQRVINALAYPTSAERFFDAGQERLEEEIQRLQDAGAELPEVLRTNPSVFQQQQDLQRLEQPSVDEEFTPQTRASRIGSFSRPIY